MPTRCNICGKVIEPGAEIVTMDRSTEGSEVRKLLGKSHASCFTANIASPELVRDYILKSPKPTKKSK